MARMQRKLLSTPDEVRPFTHGRAEIWELGDAVIGKQVFEPGWRWSNDVKPVAQTDTCEYHHLGMVMSGRVRFETPDGLDQVLIEKGEAVLAAFGRRRDAHD